jgi:hypothetical protein
VFSFLPGDATRFHEKILPAMDCPQHWDYREMVDEPTGMKLVTLMLVLARRNVQLWNHVFIAYLYDAIYTARDVRFSELMREDEFVR